MRITSNAISDTLVSHLQMLTQRQSTLQTQIATGQRVKEVSDDPLAGQHILALRDSAVANTQFQKNTTTHKEYATVTASALQSLQKVLDRAQEIAFAADDLDSPDVLHALGTEVGELIKQAATIANTQYRGEYIFSGTQGSELAVRSTLGPSGQVVSVEFGGNAAQSSSEIGPNLLVTSRIPGHNDSDSGELGLFSDPRAGADLFSHLISLRDQLRAGDTRAIASETRENLKRDEDNLLHHVAGNGALQSRLDAMLTLTKDQKLSIERDISQNADIDIAETVVHLTQQQTAYQATLQSAGAVMNLTLLSFLR